MIGIFDSGCGGLTVLRAIRERLPSVDVVYFGDIKNAPYGVRSREELSKLTAEGIARLRREGATSIVSACNSVSASLALSICDVFELPPDRLIEMVGPTVAYCRHAEGALALCATPATIASGIYQNAFHMAGHEVQAVALPELAGAIEQGAPTEDIERIIRDGFAEVPKPELLLLACTHYPLVQDAFERVLGVPTFDPAVAVAERVEQWYWPREAGTGTLRFLVSKESPVFARFVQQFFPKHAGAIEVVE